MAVETLIQYLVFGKSVQNNNYMPMDIIVKENADLYKESSAATLFFNTQR